MQAAAIRRWGFFVASMAVTLPSLVASTLEDVSLHFSTDAVIEWRVPTNHLPKRLWTYRRLPQIFSAAMISNGIVLAGFEKKGFPRPSTNEVVLWADHPKGEPRPPHFVIHPRFGQMSYELGDRASGSPMESARDEAAVRRAWEYVAHLGVDLGQLVKTNAGGPGTGGVFLPRQLDGIPFFDETEGFQIMFGKDGKIRTFGLMWPKLERDKNEVTATPQEIIRCIRGFKTVLVPGDEGADYFAKVKDVAHAQKLTITSVTPRYGEGMLGEEPRGDQPSKHVRPIAILGATADFGTNVTRVRIYAPILAADVRQLCK